MTIQVYNNIFVVIIFQKGCISSKMCMYAYFLILNCVMEKELIFIECLVRFLGWKVDRSN